MNASDLSDQPFKVSLHNLLLRFVGTGVLLTTIFTDLNAAEMNIREPIIRPNPEMVKRWLYCLVRSIDYTLRTKKGPDQGHVAVKLYQVFLDALPE